MIATDPLSLVFFACFLVGLVFFIATALLGNLGHGASHTGATHHVQAGVGHTGQHGAIHAGSHGAAHSADVHHPGAGRQHASALSFLNPTAVMLFLLGFGFFGYLFHNFISFEAPILALIVAAIGGIVVAALLLMTIARIFGNSEGATVQDVSDRTGLLGKVSITIQENGLGEIIYISPGGMRKSIPARSIDGRRLERDQEVVVVNYSHGIAEVDTWEHFIGEDGAPSRVSASDDLDRLRTLLDESSKADSELVMRKDPQKE